MSQYSDKDIAIIGMAGIFPEAPNADKFWQNIINKVDAISDPPEDAWEAELFYDPDSAENDRVYCKKGGYIGRIATFNPLQNGVMPKQVAGGEPDQWLALELAKLALEDAGYVGDFPERHRTAVIIGRGTYLNRGNTTHFQHGTFVEQMLQILRRVNPEFTDEEMQVVRRELKKGLPPFNPDTAPGLIPNIIAGRIANKLDLMGPAYTTDGACASSFLALSQAVNGLQYGDFDLALVGGAQVVTPVPVAMLFCQLNALSHQEKIRPFDEEADGTVLGEGIGMVVLKPVLKALADGNHIYAVIRGVGTASDGRGLSVMAPRQEGEVTAMQRAYARSGIDPRSLALIEAHGTATLVGDTTEIEALRTVFGDAAPGQPPAIALGTVKSMIGHTIPASGIAGMIKVAMALHHRILPPTLNVTRPNQQLAGSNLYVNTEPRPWIHGDDSTPRRGGVNAFGFGGINAHVILEEFQVADETQLESHLKEWETELCLISAESRPDLLARAGELAQTVEEKLSHLSLKDLAYTFNVAQTRGSHVLAVIANDHADLAHKLRRAVDLLNKPGKGQIKDTRGGIYYFDEPLGRSGQLAFLFPGEGSQYLNMLADLCFHFPEIRASFDRIDRIFMSQGRDYKPSDVIFPRPTYSKEELQAAEERLYKMKGAIEAVLTSNYALFLLLQRLGVKPDVILGHSTGEYSAMLAAEMVRLDTPEKIAQFTAELHDIYDTVADQAGIPQATLLACAAGAEQLQPLIDDLSDVFIGMDNCPHQAVLVGEAGAMEEAARRLSAKGIIFEKLGFDRPYHTPLFRVFEESTLRFFEKWLTNASPVKMYSCTTVAPFSDDVAEVRQVATRHWVDKVRFSETIEQMHADGVRLFVEVGPRGNLTAFVGDILRKQEHAAAAMNIASRSGITQLNHLLGLLAAHGIQMDLTYLYARRRPQAIDLQAPPQPERGRINLKTGWTLLDLPETVAQQLRAAHPAQATRSNGEKATATPAVQVSADSAPAPSRPSTPAPAPTRPASPPVAPIPTGPQPVAATPAPVVPAAAQAAPPKPAPVTPANLTPPIAPAMPVVAAAQASGLPIGRRQTQALPEIMAAYMQTMDQFLTAQEEVMRTFMTGHYEPGQATHTIIVDAPPENPATPPPPPPLPAAFQPPATPPAATPPSAPPLFMPPPPAAPTLPSAPPMGPPALPAAPAQPRPDVIVTPPAANQPTSPPTTPAASPTVAPAAAADRPGLQAMLLEIISERTGYPADLIKLDVDLEADLGIDSIKKVEILGAFQKQFDQTLPAEQVEALTAMRTLQEIIDFMEQIAAGEAPAAAAQAAPVASPAPVFYPFVRQIVKHTPGDSAEILCELNMAEDVLLEDHTLGRQIAFTDPNLTGLPVMPLTGTIEMLAEAAAVLAPGKTLVRFEDILAYRWIALDEGRQIMRMLARRRDEARKAPDEIAIHVMMWEGDIRAPIAEATVIFGDAYRQAPASQSLKLNDQRPSSWPGERLYEESLMFHGDRFRGVKTMDVWSDNGAVGTLEILPEDRLFTSTNRPNFVIDPVLFDQIGQVVGFWGLEYLPSGVVMFPYRVREVHVYGPKLTPGTRVTCNCWAELLGENQVRANFEVVRPDGSLWLKLISWEDRRFALPPTFFRFVFASPRERVLSHAWEPPAGAPVIARQLSLSDFPDDFFTAHSQIWRRVLVFAVLSARERAMWRALKMPPHRQLEWLLARVVAKDAVREHLKAEYNLLLCPADVEIIPDENGRPTVQGPWLAQVKQAPQVSLAHAHGQMVAIVHPSALGVGVDIEQAGAFPPEGQEMAFTPAELALLEALPTDTDWQMRLWCAKEAVGKALGHGLAGRPKGVRVQAVDSSQGIVTVGFSAEVATQIQRDPGFTLAAYTAQVESLIVATAVNLG